MSMISFQPAVRIGSGFDAAPTIALTKALAALGVLDLPADHNRATLTILPRSSDLWAERQMRADAWYDLAWTHPTVVTEGGPYDPAPTVGHVELATVGTLPAPAQIPAEIRIAAAPPATIDHLSEEQLRVAGGREAAQEWATQQRDASIRRARTADTYDWQAYATAVAERVRALLPAAPKLTAGQRAHVAAVRLLEANQQVIAARESLAALLANADQASDDVTPVRDVMDLIDPTPATV